MLNDASAAEEYVLLAVNFQVEWRVFLARGQRLKWFFAHWYLISYQYKVLNSEKETNVFK